jgi:hypothetical protein
MQDPVARRKVFVALSALMLSFPGCGGVESRGVDEGEAGSAIGGQGGQGGSVGEAAAGGGAAGITATAGTNQGGFIETCQKPEPLPPSDPGCPNNNSFSEPGSHCDHPGSVCFGSVPTGFDFCVQPPIVASQLCCENGWLERFDSSQRRSCPIPVANQDPRCPPPRPVDDVSCSVPGLACGYKETGTMYEWDFTCCQGKWTHFACPSQPDE